MPPVTKVSGDPYGDRKDDVWELFDRISQKHSILSCFFHNFLVLCLMFSCYMLLALLLPPSGGISWYCLFGGEDWLSSCLSVFGRKSYEFSAACACIVFCSFSYLKASYVQFVFSPLVVTVFAYLRKMLRDCVWLCPQCYKMLTYYCWLHYFSMLLFLLVLITP